MSAFIYNKVLPFLLQRDNVARYKNGELFIGNRLKYPFEKSMMRCIDVESIANAIENMITQGGGQWIAAAYGLAIAARKVDSGSKEEIYGYIDRARVRLINTRSTNAMLIKRLNEAMIVVQEALDNNLFVENAILRWIDNLVDSDYEEFAKMGHIGADIINDGDGILTMCFAEMSFLFALAFAKKDGKNIKVYTPETRPYLQGARLTAPSIYELGIPVQIIGDNMSAYLCSQLKINKYFTAADLVTMDGYVVNKIGTFQNAISVSYHKIPYYVFCLEPDTNKPDYTSIVIEERNPAEMKCFRGIQTTLSEIDAYYPAFDITPPNLVSGVITKKGIFNPFELKQNFDCL